MITDRDKLFGLRMAELCEIHQRKPTKLLLDSYERALIGLSTGDLFVALDRAIRECKFFPKPQEIWELAGQGLLKLKADAAVAWQAVYVAMEDHDYTTSVDFGPLVNTIVRNMGGWYVLCSKTIKELVWERKRFEELYQLFGGANTRIEGGAPLRGAFGGTPVRISIGGAIPAARLGETESPATQDIVRALADAKAAR